MYSVRDGVAYEGMGILICHFNLVSLHCGVTYPFAPMSCWMGGCVESKRWLGYD